MSPFRHPHENGDPEMVAAYAGMTWWMSDCVKMTRSIVKQFYVYIVCSKRNGTLYIGVTSDLNRRIYEHKNKLVEGFTKRHSVNRLVYFEVFESAVDAIRREKQLKKWNRAWKLALIEKANPEWSDLYEVGH